MTGAVSGPEAPYRQEGVGGRAFARTHSATGSRNHQPGFPAGFRGSFSPRTPRLNTLTR
jgi:hypothetical protein